MKPAPFTYYAPTTLEEALVLLAQHGEEAKPLAGGQSLVPLMNFRLARPSVLVDLNRIPGLAYIWADDGGLAIGAMTRQRAVETSALVWERCPLLAEATALIGHVQIRQRGTLGGSLAHADPASEDPAVAVALGAQLRLLSTRGERWTTAEEFFQEAYATTLAPDELVVEVRFPAQAPRTGGAFVELSRRHGDFALVGVAAILTLGDDGRCQRARLAVTGMGAAPLCPLEAEALLAGEPPTENLFREAGQRAAAVAEPPSDYHASAEYRRHLVGVLTTRALTLALARARGRS